MPLLSLRPASAGAAAAAGEVRPACRHASRRTHNAVHARCAQGVPVVKTRIVAMLLTGLLAGCSVGPNYRAPKVTPPVQWSTGTNASSPVVEWWKTFND